ncbi:MAG: DUF4926 domain-containing protein [Planctomycetes bacterium]|nr:DUF4926 domain-containing protein [Planctomycetota bacterium]
MLQERNVVALTVNRPQDDLRIGDVGAVVHCYKDTDTYEVEFLDANGKSKCVATVPVSEVMRLNLLSLSA